MSEVDVFDRYISLDKIFEKRMAAIRVLPKSDGIAKAQNLKQFGITRVKKEGISIFFALQPDKYEQPPGEIR